MNDIEYKRSVDSLYKWAVEVFQHASGDTSIRIALCTYLIRGLRAGFAQGELIDFLGVSSPSVLDAAGYDSSRSNTAMQILASITDEEIEEAKE